MFVILFEDHARAAACDADRWLSNMTLAESKSEAKDLVSALNPDGSYGYRVLANAGHDGCSLDMQVMT